jgi:tight adherence protein B
MLFLAAVFITILLVVFGIFAFFLRPEKGQSEMDKRLAMFSIARSQPVTLPGESPLLARAGKPTAIRWIEDLVEQERWAKKLNLLILQSHSSTTVSHVLVTISASALVVAATIFWVTSMPLASFAAALVAGYVPIMWLRMRRQKRILAFNAVLPDCIETCARSLRAGHSIVSAIDIVAEQSAEPAREEFREVFKKQNYGLPLRDALEQMVERMPSPDLRVLITGILVQKDTGGNLAEIMDRIAIVIRDRTRIAGDVRTHTAQGRLTGWILILLPVLMLLVLNLVNPGYSRVLFTDPTGKEMLYVGILLLVLGGVLINKIIKGIEV